MKRLISNWSKWESVLVLLGIVLLVSGVYSQSTLPVVRIGYLTGVSTATEVIQGQAIDRQNGFEMLSVPFNSSDEITEALMDGRIDAGMGFSVIAILQNKEQIENIRVISFKTMTPNNKTDGFVVQAADIQKITDFEGKRIGVFPGSTGEPLLREYLKRNGVDDSEIVFIPINRNIQVDALSTGAVDILYAYEPILSEAAVNEKFRIVSGSPFTEMSPKSFISATALTKKWGEENPVLVKRLEKALMDGREFEQTNPEKMVKIRMKAYSITERAARLVPQFEIMTFSQANASDYQLYLDFLNEVGVIYGPVLADELLWNHPTK